MKELALHILDIAQNSIRAGATLIEIIINEDLLQDTLTIEIRDNGNGMDQETLKRVEDPFFTTRTTRKVGLGISLLKSAAIRCEGEFKIQSVEGEGTVVKAVFKHSHIDRAPLGNIAETIAILLLMEREVDYLYTHYYNNKSFSFSTVDIKKVLKELPITDYHVIDWVKKYIKDGIEEIVNI